MTETAIEASPIVKPTASPGEGSSSPWADENQNIDYGPEEHDSRTFRELVHAGVRYTGYATQWEAGVRCTRSRVLVHGDDGRWYVMTRGNARKYYLQCDTAKRREQS